MTVGSAELHTKCNFSESVILKYEFWLWSSLIRQLADYIYIYKYKTERGRLDRKQAFWSKNSRGSNTFWVPKWKYCGHIFWTQGCENFQMGTTYASPLESFTDLLLGQPDGIY